MFPDRFVHITAVTMVLVIIRYTYGMSLQTGKPTLFNLKLSPMVENMEVSKTIEIHAMTKDMEKNNLKVYSLCVGEPDYQPPPPVIDATNLAALEGLTKYTAVTGDANLRKAIATDLKQRKGIQYTPEQIVVANGAKQSVIQALMAIISPGDHVLIPAPYWTSYPDMVKMCQAFPTIIKTSASNNYVLTPKALRESLEMSPKSSCLILCNPSNPTGSIISSSQLYDIAQVLQDFPKVAVLSDEIYDRLVYDGLQHTSMAAIPEMYDRTITVNGFSKSHAMTGYRLGYSASSLAIAKACSKIQSQITSCASSISQHAGYYALTKTKPEWFVDRLVELQRKRDLAYSIIQSIPDVTCPKPQGAFYLLPDVSRYFHTKTKTGKVITNSHELCLELLREEQVAVVSGDAFGAPECLRISYATSEDIIEESLQRMKRFLLSLVTI